MSLSSNVLVVVAGASSLVGRSILAQSSKRGHATLAIGRSGAIEADHVLKCDLAGDDCVPEIQRVVDNYSVVHAVNCAGHFPGFLRTHATDKDIYAKCINDNFITTAVLARAVLARMRVTKSGHFIAFSSHMIDESCPYMGAWNCAKAAVEALVKTISNEYLGDGVIANVVRLPTLDTPSERSLKPSGDFGSWLEPDEVAEFCLGLIALGAMSPRASALHFFKSSRSFYGRSFLERNGLEALGEGGT